jgi:hypothetical protein
MTVNIAVLLVMTPYSLVEFYGSFRASGYLDHQRLYWRQQVAVKRLNTYASEYGALSQTEAN